MGEIITLQVGGYSNWVGSHTWNLVSSNLENEHDSSELFTSEKIKPRVAIFDIRNRRGSLFMPEVVESHIPPWTNNVDRFCTDPHQKLNMNWDAQATIDPNQQNMVWSDFMECPLNEVSYNEIPVWDSRAGMFSSFYAGDFQHPDCCLSPEFREQCFDVLRLLLEDCNQPQGCRCILDMEGGFAGMGTSMVAEFRDQCRSSAISCDTLLDTPSLPTDSPLSNDMLQSESKNELRNNLGHAVTMHGLLEYANLVFPLTCSVPKTELVDPFALLKNSAYLATFVDGCSLPYRRGYQGDRKLLMHEWCSILSPRKDMRVMSAEMAIPSFSTSPSTVLELSHLSPTVPIEPCLRWSHLMISRGIESSQCPCFDYRSKQYSFAPAFLPTSFPLGIYPATRGYVPVRTGNSLISAGSSSALHPWLASLTDSLACRKPQKVAARRESQLTDEDALSIFEELTSLADAYSPS